VNLGDPDFFVLMRKYFVYILASKENGTLYIGVTNDIEKRIWEHKNNIIPGFTQTYKVHKLVHVEEFTRINDAILREKHLKKWKREWKIELIEESNPNWNDIFESNI